MFRKFLNLFATGRIAAGRRENAPRYRRNYRFETLEDRRLLAISWANEFNPNNQFDDFYGGNEAIARQLVNRAINDWEDVIIDSNLSLDIFAGSISGRGGTSNVTYSNGRPTSADITLDDNGGGVGWFFDPTPFDDAEFTAIVNSGINGTEPAFQASFIDVAGGHVDFYRTIVHEIGHAMGLASSSPAFALTNNPWMTFIDDDPEQFGADLYSFHRPGSQFGETATITTDGGRHLYEGSHPSDLMNAGRITPVGTPTETTRQLISELNVKILADAYGYSVVLPSTLDTMHATLDLQTGTLLVQSGVNSAGDARNESIYVELADQDTIRVRTVGPNVTSTELFLRTHVSQLVIARNGGTDGVVVDPDLDTPGFRKEVQYVVSSNQDPLTVPDRNGDGRVDHDMAVPGRQTSLRGAAADIFGTSAGSSMYVPRGQYNLTTSGSSGFDEGDIDIDKHTIIIGSGAGATIIDGSTLATRDRIFETLGSGSLDLSHVTLTGGQTAGDGGAIRVNDNTTTGVRELTLRNVAIVENTATNASGFGSGGGVYFAPKTEGLVYRSVITDNTAQSTDLNQGEGGGGLFAGGNATEASKIKLDHSVIAENDAFNGQGEDLFSVPIGQFISLDGNLFTSVAGSNFATSGLEANDFVSGTVDYVVTSVVDSLNSLDDARARSLRDAVDTAIDVPGTSTIWLPAWHFLLTGTGDFDVDLGHMVIVGAGPGATIIDGSTLAVRDRLFETHSSGSLDLSRVTLTGGQTALGGGAIRVNNNGNGIVRELTLSDVAIVANRATSASGFGNGGGIYFAPNATGRIERSVITDNETEESAADGGGGGIYAGHPDAEVTLRDTIVALNTAAAGTDLLSIGSGEFVSEGGNQIADLSGSNFHNGLGLQGTDFTNLSVGFVAPNQVVTSVVDSYAGSNATRVNSSIRDAVFNASAGETIWLPAWKYVLTRERTTATNLVETDVSQGDIDITKSLTIRGAGQADMMSGLSTKSSVAWRTGAPVDDVFELIGDYNDDGMIDDDPVTDDPADVDSADYTVWQDTKGSQGANLDADGNDDGVVNDLDRDIWDLYFNNTLTLENLVETELT